MPRKHHAGKMSIMTESNVYECPGEERGSSDKLCFRVYENSGQFIYMPKMDDDSMEIESSIEEQRSPEKSGVIVEDIPNYHRAQHSLIYHGDQIDQLREGKVSHDSFTSLDPSDLKMEDQWEEHNSYDSSAMDDNSFEENQFSESHYNNDNPVTVANEDTENVDDSDEETIATFLTAAGQRLALYAVEDSDQVFAVAVYDESGAPPTNFQFLVKSDVERLIGEGAVRTVKKPTQMKKQVLTNESPLQAPPPLHYTEQPYTDIPLESDEHEYDDKESKELLMATSVMNEKARLLESYKMVENTNEKLRTILSYSPVNDFVADQSETFEEECAMEEEKLIVRSTVDDLFMEDEKSEDELTFADIEETLGKFLPSEKRSPILCQSSRSSWQDTSMESEPEFALHEEESPKMDYTRKELLPITKKEPKEENVAKMIVTTVNSSMKTWKRTNLVRNSHAASSSTLLAYRCSDGGVKEQREVISGASLLIGNNERTKSIASEPDRGPEVALIGSPKAKRPRKQQLTSVNRGDSEIIIQPATFPNEDDEDEEDGGGFRRKRVYRRKRKQVRTSVRYKMKASVTKRRGGSRQRGDRAQPKKQYEIIEIDVDEEDRLSGSGGSKNKNIVEITLDESREKGSSDKENQVIMVGDSDDDDDEDDDEEDIARADSSKSGSSVVTSLKCEYCSRTFRQKRAVKTHSRLCPKSPKNIKRLEERTLRSNDSSVPKKEFACKICHEKFDVVVVLARHVKSMHSMRKKPNSSQDTSNATVTATTAAATTTLNKTRKERGSKSTEEKKEPGEPATFTSSATTAAAATAIRKGPRRRRRRRKRIKSNHQGWKGQKLHCSDCAKWFSSAALLASHSLQHATKKSENRRCQTCKKILKSKLLYIRHMRMHSRVKTLQKKLHHTRQATVKLATLRKHGSRPRKLRSSNVYSDIYP